MLSVKTAEILMLSMIKNILFSVRTITVIKLNVNVKDNHNDRKTAIYMFKKSNKIQNSRACEELVSMRTCFNGVDKPKITPSTRMFLAFPIVCLYE